MIRKTDCFQSFIDSLQGPSLPVLPLNLRKNKCAYGSPLSYFALLVILHV